jgi:uncharacterized protein YndB with AHSA1/START domain
MSTVHVQIRIDAPPQLVWETIMDPTRLGDWVTIHRSVTVKSADAVTEGARMDQVLHVMGVSFKVHWTLESVREPRRAEWQGRGPAMSRAVIRYGLTANEDGSTKFDYVNEFHPPGGPLGSMASRVVAGHISEREAQDSLTRLKRLVESQCSEAKL